MPRGRATKTPERVEQARDMRARGYLLREIADEIGIAVQTVDAWLRDPDGAALRARKASYRGRCACGRATTGCNGAGSAPDVCADCFARRNAERDREIARLYDDGSPVSDIAARFGLSEHAIYYAAARGGAKPRLSASGSMEERRARRRAAVAMANAGASFSEIAAHLGYKNAASAGFAVRNELRKAAA